MTALPSFDPRRAFEHIENLSYPRGVGTPRERRAARYVLREFVSLGLVVRREPFRVRRFPIEVGSRLVFALCAGLAWLGSALAIARPLAACLCWGAAGLLVNSPWRLAFALGKRWPSRTTSENLLGLWTDAPGSAPARVVFMAHYDTKSQLFPTGVRVGLVAAAVVTSALLTILGLVAAAGSPTIWAWASPAGLSAIVVVALAALSLNLTGNRSPGALDNGSGVGTLLELARTWRPQDKAPIEVVWVASGSEEVGLDGARDFVRRHYSWWTEKPTLLINLESVGAGNLVRLAGEPGALALTEQIAARLGTPSGRLRVVGAGMDHQPFAARDLAAVSLLGDVVRHGLAMHSRRDDLGLIELPALDRAGRLAGELAWAWAALHQPGWGAVQPADTAWETIPVVG